METVESLREERDALAERVAQLEAHVDRQTQRSIAKSFRDAAREENLMENVAKAEFLLSRVGFSNPDIDTKYDELLGVASTIANERKTLAKKVEQLQKTMDDQTQSSIVLAFRSATREERLKKRVERMRMLMKAVGFPDLDAETEYDKLAKVAKTIVDERKALAKMVAHQEKSEDEYSALMRRCARRDEDLKDQIVKLKILLNITGFPDLDIVSGFDQLVDVAETIADERKTLAEKAEQLQDSIASAFRCARREEHLKAQVRQMKILMHTIGFPDFDAVSRFDQLVDVAKTIADERNQLKSFLQDTFTIGELDVLSDDESEH